MSQGVGLIRPLPPDRNVHIIIHLNNTMNKYVLLKEKKQGRDYRIFLLRLIAAWTIGLPEISVTGKRLNAQADDLPIIAF